jgi:hypothetical protein
MGSITNILALLSAWAGLISLGITLVGAFFIIKSGKLQSANAAQGSAISALQAEMEVSRKKDEDKDKEITRLKQEVSQLKQTIVTICVALKRRFGLIITVDDDMVSIEDKRGNSTTTRIRHASAGGQADNP